MSDKLLAEALEKAWRDGWRTGYRAGRVDGGSDSEWCDEEGDWRSSDTFYNYVRNDA